MIKGFTRKVIMLVVIAVVSLSVLIGCQTIPSTPPGDPVSSGEFYDFVVHHYTVVFPPLLEARDAEKGFASLPIDRGRWTFEDENGQIFDYTSRLKYRKERDKASLERGTLWDISIKIKKAAMTDATHGAVLWTLINDWENAERTRRGRSSRRYVSYWEKIGGQWRMVAAKRGRAY